MTGRVLGLVAFVLSASTALGQTQAQRNVIDHIAQAMTVAELCSRVSLNNTLAVVSMSAHGVDLDQPRFRSEMTRRMHHHTTAMRKHRPEIVCVSGVTLYGRSGANVPGLLLH